MRTSSRLHQTPLSACLGAALALAAPAVLATKITVSNCNNSGSGSLRDAVNSATTGDSVDLSGLKTSDTGCSASSITLTTGGIHVAVDDLTVTGPGIDKLTITAGNNSRIFDHTGSGTLGIKYLSMTDGYHHSASGNAYGGCIYSSGSVALTQVGVSHCEADVSGPVERVAEGGGIYTKGSLTMKYSSLTDARAHGAVNGLGFGGGVSSHKGLFAYYSTISNNKAQGVGCTAGGLEVINGNLILSGSTVSGNVSCDGPGGIRVNGFSATTTISNSTISGNANNGGNGGGLFVEGGGTVVIQNSTIAFNTAYGDTQFGNFVAAGAAFYAIDGAYIAVTLQSTLIANNSFGTTASDLSAAALTTDGSFVSISGANNLVYSFAPSNLSIPADTINTCPLLGPLRDNGGPTYTHALLSNSAAIDAGNNLAKFTFDQRGNSYERASGPAADIGAYELQQADIVFSNGFDACP